MILPWYLEIDPSEILDYSISEKTCWLMRGGKSCLLALLLPMAEADLSLTPFSDFDLHLPTSNADFLQANFDLASLNDQIQQAEH